MKTFPLGFPQHLIEEIPEEVSSSDVFMDWVSAALTRGLPGELSLKEAAMVYKLKTLIKSALDEGSNFVELEDGDFHFLKEAFSRARFPSQNYKAAAYFADIFEV